MTPQADQYKLETPENIEVEFELAGLGSRFCAMLIDTALIVLMVIVLGLLAFLLGVDFQWTRGDHGLAAHWGTWFLAAIQVIVVALFSGGYFIFFELWMRGQTPGKRSMRIRVIRDDGTPVAANEVLVRNILRLIDFLPVAYGLGTLVMFPNPMCKRLGDMAAGTIVVKEGHLDYRAHADQSKKRAPEPEAVNASNAELTAEERRLLTGFLQRREQLLPAARRELAERLASPLYAKYAGRFDDAESYLERLVKGRHYES
jgi:uncharacterized RDD family membrane protein YckC